MISILIPIIITALGLAYILSPLNFIGSLILGPLYFADDFLVFLIILLAWIIFFSAPLIEMVFNVMAGVIVIGVLIYAINWLWRKSK